MTEDEIKEFIEIISIYLSDMKEEIFYNNSNSLIKLGFELGSLIRYIEEKKALFPEEEEE